MKIRRIMAMVEYVRETQTTCGMVYRTLTATFDVTRDVLALSHEDLRRMGDTNVRSLRLGRRLVVGEVQEVIVLQSILDHFGVDRIKEITPADLHAARCLQGMVRERVRPKPQAEARLAA